MAVMVCERCGVARDVSEAHAAMVAGGSRINRCRRCAQPTLAARGPRCVHCRVWKAGRPRGLCNGCYSDLDVRNLYPSGGSASEADFCGAAPLPDEPTSAAPSTVAKLLVMAARAARKQQLFHPDDEKRLDGVQPHELLPVPHARRATA